MKIQAVAIKEVTGVPELWQEIVGASPDGWFWNTWTNHEFNLCAGQKFNAIDYSFFIYDDDRAVGVVPLIIQERVIDGVAMREAVYYSGFLPWPCIRHDVENREEVENFVFEEIEKRAREAGVRRVLMRLIPPRNIGNEESRVSKIAETHGYTVRHFDSHVVEITNNTLKEVRERYRRYYKKYSSLFTLSVAEKADVTLELEQTYFELHVKDAVGQFRSRESYTKQSDIARAGEAFYVVATHTESGTVAGMLLVSLYKNAAYDNSVAVDPDFADMRVSHLLKWRAIEELQSREVATYELGLKADPLSSTPKELGITHFKEGWSRGHTRPIWEVEKLL